jgi:hypothetical protein
MGRLLGGIKLDFHSDSSSRLRSRWARCASMQVRGARSLCTSVNEAAASMACKVNG